MKRRGRRTIIALGLPVGLALAGGLAYMQLASASTPPPETPDPGPGQHGPMLALTERVINLAPGGAFRYVKVGVTIELRPESADFYALTGEARAVVEEELAKSEEGVVPLLLDQLGQAVAAKTSDSLAAPDGRAVLKDELLAGFRHVLGEEKVLAVYFTDFVMQ
jgi:flagellar FliL protein